MYVLLHMYCFNVTYLAQPLFVRQLGGAVVYTTNAEFPPPIAAIRWSRSSRARFLWRSATGSLVGTLSGTGVRGNFVCGFPMC